MTVFFLELLRVAAAALAPVIEVRVLFLVLDAFTGGEDGSGDMEGNEEAVDNLDDRRAGVFSSFAGLALVAVPVRGLRAVRNGGKGAISSSSWSSSSSSNEPGMVCARTGPLRLFLEELAVLRRGLGVRARG